MPLETETIAKGDTVVVTAVDEATPASWIGETGTVLRVVTGFATLDGEPCPPLFKVRFSSDETGVFREEEVEKRS